MTGAAATAAASAATASGTPTKNASKGSELFRIQLLVLLVQLGLPIYYYHTTITAGTWLTGVSAADGEYANVPSSRVSAVGGEYANVPSSPTKADDSNNAGVSESRGPIRPPAAVEGGTRHAEIDPSQVVGTFNNVPISYVPPSTSSPLHSTAHCIGETFHDTSWVHRSCEYRNICFDTIEKEFVLFRSPVEASLAGALDRHNVAKEGLLTVSSSLNTTVSLGGINMKWTWKPTETGALEWSPIVRNEELTEGYYALPPDTVLLPFHSMAAVNPGHLMWDDLLPIYSMLSAFEMTAGGTATTSTTRILPLRYVLKNRERALWATCNLRDQTLAECKMFFRKLLPLMGVDPRTMRSTEDSVLNITDGSPEPKSRYICSNRGAAGLGMHTDHGLKQAHGWQKGDYDLSHNAGRGPVLTGFRNFMMRNIGMDPMQTVRQEPPFVITISPSSSKDPDRKHSFNKQIDALRAAFPDEKEVTIQTVNFSKLAIEEQIQIASESAVMIGACGGGAFTNMFMSKGSGMVLYYPEKPRGPQHNYPARLDFDYFNNQGYTRVHWLPTGTMNFPEDLDILVKLVQNEIETISHH